MPTLSEKLESAKRYLGHNWVLDTKSIYDVRRREHSGWCQTLRPIALKAMQEGRI